VGVAEAIVVHVESGVQPEPGMQWKCGDERRRRRRSDVHTERVRAKRVNRDEENISAVDPAEIGLRSP
jgi:hypothetical protein